MHSKHVGYTFIIDLMLNTGLYNQRGPKYEVGRGFTFFISLICAFQDVWKPKKKRIRNSFKTMSLD